MTDGSISDSFISAGSIFNNDSASFGPGRARLNQTGGYRAQPNSQQAFISVNFPQPMIVTGIATQGYSNSTVDEWLTSFLMGYTFRESAGYFKESQGDASAKVIRTTRRIPLLKS